MNDEISDRIQRCTKEFQDQHVTRVGYHSNNVGAIALLVLERGVGGVPWRR